MKRDYIIINTKPETVTSKTLAKRKIFAKANKSNDNPLIKFGNFDMAEAKKLSNSVEKYYVSIPTKLVVPIKNKINKNDQISSSFLTTADFSGNKNSNELASWGKEAVGGYKTDLTGSGIIVAILDTGIDATHLMFKDLNIVQKDFTGEGDGDKNGHGTHCAGIIAGRATNNIDVGIAPGIDKLLVGKVLKSDGNGTSQMLMEGILWAVNNKAHVISMSVGFDFANSVAILVEDGIPSDLATSWALEEYMKTVELFSTTTQLIDKLIKSNPELNPSIIIAAAGNESKRDIDPDYVLSLTPPAVCNGIISVAAVGKNDDGSFYVAPFSNRGATVAAPGVDIISAEAGGDLITYSGTSMATPHVAGVAALVIEKMYQRGKPSIQSIYSKVSTSCKTENFTSDINTADIGEGLIFAPQS